MSVPTQYRAFVTKPRITGRSGKITEVTYILVSHTPGVEYGFYSVKQIFSLRRLARPVTSRVGDAAPPAVMRLRERGEAHVTNLEATRASAAEEPNAWTTDLNALDPQWLRECFEERLEMLREAGHFPIGIHELPGGGYPPLAFIRKAEVTQPRILEEDEAEAIVENLSGAGSYYQD